jgi:enoyl-CoA hydratase/carnithine racemase
MEPVVLTARAGQAFHVTINRPDKLNALSVEVWERLGDAFEEFAQSDARVCVLQGAGRKAFVAGADIEQYLGMSQKAFEKFIVDAGRVANRIFEIPKPFIAAIYGYALGGGLELALHCDLIVANKSAKLGLPEANLGLLPGGGGTAITPRLIGRAKTNEMIMRGRWLRGEEASNCGLISAVLDDDNFDEELAKYVEEVCKRGPLAIGTLKAIHNKGASLSLADALQLEIDLTSPLMESHDGQEGVRAFMEKRESNFNGS